MYASDAWPCANRWGSNISKGMSSKRERKTNGQSTKPRQQRRIRRIATMIDGVGDMGTIMSTMTVIGLRKLKAAQLKL